MKAINGDKFDPTSETVRKIVGEHADQVLKTLIFADSIDLPADGIDGSDLYEKEFVEAGVKHNAYSLRDLRLQKRIFKYRCSYMIRSKGFDVLPEPIKREVLVRLNRIVTDQATYPGMPKLSSREKERIHEILVNTHEAYRKVANGE